MELLVLLAIIDSDKQKLRFGSPKNNVYTLGAHLNDEGRKSVTYLVSLTITSQSSMGFVFADFVIWLS